MALGMALFHIFATLINVWLNRRQQDSRLCICIQSVVMPCFYQSIWWKSCLTKIMVGRGMSFFKRPWGPWISLWEPLLSVTEAVGCPRACDQWQTSQILGDKVKAQLKPKSPWITVSPPDHFSFSTCHTLFRLTLIFGQSSESDVKKQSYRART